MKAHIKIITVCFILLFAGWMPFKGVLLRHIIISWCYDEKANTVIIGQDNNNDGKADKCFMLKGGEETFYREVVCPTSI